MKKQVFILCSLLFVLGFTSCVSLNQIGQLNMISNRNINPAQKYQLLATYVGSNQADMKKSRFTTIQEAIDATVMQVPGGEYLMNARIFKITHGNGKDAKIYYWAEGDVWGISQTK